MSETQIEKLISSVEQISQFSINDFVGLLSIIFPFITLLYLLIERYEKNKPYLQINLELIRSTLACITIRNLGNVPIELTKINFDNEFINQLTDNDKKHLQENNITNIVIFPNNFFVITFGVAMHEIIQRYTKKDVTINYEYKKLGRRKVIKNTINIDFTQYKTFLVYISEIDELQNSVNKKFANIEAILKRNNNLVEKLNKSIEVINFSNIEDSFIKTVITKKETND